MELLQSCTQPSTWLWFMIHVLNTPASTGTFKNFVVTESVILWDSFDNRTNQCIAWISYYYHDFVLDVIIYPCPNLNAGLTKPQLKVRAWMSIYIPLFYVDVIRIHALTHWGRDKMATIFQTIFSKAFSWMKMRVFRFKYVPKVKGPINTIPTVVQIMAWRRPGDNPLFEPYMRHSASLS